MNTKKIISVFAAMAVAASSFVSFAVTANAADVSLYTQDFESMTTETMTGVNNSSNSNNQTTNTIETDSTNYLKIYGPSDRDRASNFIFGTSVTKAALTAGKGNISFRTKLASGNFAGTGVGRTGQSAIYVLPDGATATPSSGAAPTEYLFGLQVESTSDANDKSTIVSRKVYLLSGSDAVTLHDTGTSSYEITTTNSAVATTNWISVSADVDFNAGTAKVKINNSDPIAINLKTTTKTGFEGFGAVTGSKQYGTVMLDDIAVTTADPESVVTTDYTVEYRYEENLIKSATVNDVTVGDTPSLTEAQLEPFVENEQKYYCVSNDAAEQTIAAGGTTVVTVTLRLANVYNVNVNAVYADAGNAALVTGQAVTEGDSFDFYYPKYAEYNDKYYTAAQEQFASKSYYKGTQTPTYDGQTYDVNYILYSNSDNVVYYSEAEDITGMTESTVSNANIRCSNGKGAYAPSDVIAINLPAGTYKITAAVWGSSGTTYTIKAGEDTVYENTTTGSLAVTTGSAFTLDAATNIIIATAGSNNDALDYILIEKAPDITNVTANEALGSTLSANTIKDTEDNTVTLTAAGQDAKLTTVYVYVTNPVEGVSPVVTISGLTGDNAENNGSYTAKSTFDDAAGHGYYMVQFLVSGDDTISVDSVTYTGAAEWTPTP